MNYGSPITGTLTGTTAVVSLPNPGVQYPATLILNSSNGSRAIQLSFDGGATYYSAVTPTLSETGQLVYALTYPATTVKFTGAANDTYTVL